MDDSAHDSLVSATERLRARLSVCSTRSVLAVVLAFHRRRAADLEYDGGLTSPARQIAFLLGILLSTPEPEDARDFSARGEWDRCVALLDEIFDHYRALMWPTEEELKAINARWRTVRTVAGQALLHFHNTGLMASVNQVADRVEAYLGPFDSAIAEVWGLGTAAALRICDHIRTAAYETSEAIATAAEVEERSRLALLDEWERQDLSLEEFRELASRTDHEAIFRELMSTVDALGIIREADLVESFGEEGRAFWHTFAISRGAVELMYPTERNPVDTHPLIACGPGVAVCPSINALYESVLLAGELTLEAAPVRGAYHRARDRTLEDQSFDALLSILGSTAQGFRSVYETADNHFEHDIVIVVGRDLLVVEAKASPPKEPFRDLERGFVRIQRAFRSDTGLQTAYDQADRIRRRLALGENVQLFDKDGVAALDLHPEDLDDVFTACVTRDDFGPLAVDLALLLERPDEAAPFPWAVPILSLQTVAMAWEYLDRNAADFVSFLKVRRQLHGRIICWDELDVVGFHLKHGGLHWLLDPRADMVHINPHYADVFDDIHRAVDLDGPPVSIEVSEPFMGDVREMLTEMLGQLSSAKRNDPCPCGSGKKFKKCHGRHGV